DRASLAIAEQPVDDLQAIGPVVTAVSVLGQFAAAAFEVGRADIVEHQRAVLEMTSCQLPFDAELLGAEPVKGRVDLTLLDGPEIEHPAQAGTRRLGGQ